MSCSPDKPIDQYSYINVDAQSSTVDAAYVEVLYNKIIAADNKQIKKGIGKIHPTNATKMAKKYLYVHFHSHLLIHILSLNKIAWGMFHTLKRCSRRAYYPHHLLTLPPPPSI